jgi:hypothetical protein
MPIVKRGITVFPSSFNLNAQGTDGFGQIATLTGLIANTAIQGLFTCPFNYKISKIAIALSSLTTVAGLNSFNIVVGQTAAYVQGNIAANDNSIAGPTQVVNPALTYPTAPGGMGYPTNVAVVGNSLFSADVTFNSANVFNPAGAATLGPNSPGFGSAGMGVLGTGWQALVTATGGSGIFVPTNYDAVYPAGIPLTLRLGIIAANTITNLIVAIGVEPIMLRGAPNSTAGQVIALPGTDF